MEIGNLKTEVKELREMKGKSPIGAAIVFKAIFVVVLIILSCNDSSVRSLEAMYAKCMTIVCACVCGCMFPVKCNAMNE
jgi:hypothetical protein